MGPCLVMVLPFKARQVPEASPWEESAFLFLRLPIRAWLTGPRCVPHGCPAKGVIDQDGFTVKVDKGVRA